MDVLAQAAYARSMLMKRNFSPLLAFAWLCIPGKEGREGRRLWGGEIGGETDSNVQIRLPQVSERAKQLTGAAEIWKVEAASAERRTASFPFWATASQSR